MNEPSISLHYVRANGLTMHCASCGEAGRPLVIFLHGFPEHWLAWERQLLDLGRDFLAVAPDLRGINLSDKPADVRDYRAPIVAADVVALAEALGYREFALVGHDWGGAIAYVVAIRYPERVRRLVVLNTVHPAVFAREMRESPAQVAASAYINLFRQPDAADRLRCDGFAYLREMFAQDGRVPAWFDGRMRDRYQRAWSQPGALDGGLNYYRASPLHPPVDGVLGTPGPEPDPSALRVNAPTLMVWGERDRYLLTGCAEGVEQHVPDLRIERFPEASHWIAHEQPEQVSRLIREHLHPWLPTS